MIRIGLPVIWRGFCSWQLQVTMVERAPVDGNLYELLKLSADEAGSAAQLEILRHLRAVESPAREQSGVDELERQHFEQFRAFVSMQLMLALAICTELMSFCVL